MAYQYRHVLVLKEIYANDKYCAGGGCKWFVDRYSGCCDLFGKRLVWDTKNCEFKRCKDCKEAEKLLINKQADPNG